MQRKTQKLIGWIILGAVVIPAITVIMCCGGLYMIATNTELHITEHQWESIKRGMSKQDVERILGKPQRSGPDPSHPEDITYWSYEPSLEITIYQIRFNRDGRVVDKIRSRS